MTKPTLYLNFSPNPSGRTGRPAVQPLLPRPRVPRALKAEVPFAPSGTSAHDPTGTAEGPNLADPLVRQTLPMRNAPYYLRVRPGVYLGYRVGKGQRSWVVRFQDAREKGLDYSMVLGVAPESEKKRRHLERMDYTQALGAALTLVQRLESHAPGLEIRATSVTVDEAMGHYVAWKRAEGSARIKELEQQIARHIHEPLGAIPLDQLTKQQVAQWTQGMAGTAKAVRARAGTLGFAAFPTTKARQDARRATANRVFSILRAGLNYACDYLTLPPPRHSLGHPFGDNPLRGVHEEEARRNPAGRGSGGRP